MEPPIQEPEEPSTPEDDRRVWDADLHTVPGATVTGDDLGAYRDGVDRVQMSVRKIETMGSANDFETLMAVVYHGFPLDRLSTTLQPGFSADCVIDSRN